ncbi:MBL fold metallo-hydrolase [Ostreiculturibacter nitratireducens]|uniref:MBL fold metallo-hydrolase n=1 Tax=Ostreiculturibacter nitratireducens TaxID=3075226 RepID=UPI0031B5DB33
MRSTLDWYGCATFRLRAGAITIFLDAYVDRVAGAEGPPGARADQIAACDAILIGHSHFDHIWGAERIAKRTGARVVGSYETVRILAAQGVPEAQLLPVSGGETLRLSKDVSVEVYPALHSCIWAGYNDQDPDFCCLGDQHVDYFDRRAAEMHAIAGLAEFSADLRSHMDLSNQGGRGDGGVLCFVVQTPEGRLFFKDTPGHWSGIMRGIRADVGILATSGRPNIDGEAAQGSTNEFLVSEARALGLKRVIFCHHDAWLGPVFPRGNIDGILAGFARDLPVCEPLEIPYCSGFGVFDGLASGGGRTAGGLPEAAS